MDSEPEETTLSPPTMALRSVVLVVAPILSIPTRHRPIIRSHCRANMQAGDPPVEGPLERSTFLSPADQIIGSRRVGQDIQRGPPRPRPS